MNKFLLAVSLIAGLSSQVQAHEEVVDYRYGMDLDIATVMNISAVADVCGVVPVTMTYLDSKGVSHRLQYSAFGGGCSN